MGLTTLSRGINPPKAMKILAVKLPETPHSKFLNTEYREKLLLLLESHGFTGISNFGFISLEALAYTNKLICLKWDNPHQ